MNGFPRPYGFAFAFALVVTLALSAGTASAQVFTDNVNQAIPDYPNAGFARSLTVSGAPAVIYSMRLTVNVNHTWNEDVRLYLLPPGVTWAGPYQVGSIQGDPINNPPAEMITLLRTIGSNSQNFTNTAFTSAFDPTFTGAIPVSTGTAPFTGNFTPVDAAKFDALYGTNPNGTWTVVILDDYDAFTGTFVSWSLEFVAAPDPSIVVERPANSVVFPTTTDNLTTRLQPGSANNVSYTIRNIGASNILNVTSITFDLPNATNMSSATVFPGSFTVNAQQSTISDFELEPTNPGAFSIDVTITSDALNVPSYTFTIAGVAGANIDLQRPAGTSLGIIDDLGPQPAASLTQLTYTVVNDSAVALNITDITATNPTNVTVNIPTTALTVPANSQSTFFVEVTPTDFGSFSFLLTITNNTPDKNPLQVSVIGSGVLHGTYTIDADPGNNPDFADFGEAFDALAAHGVATAVAFEVADGTYTATANYILEAIPGQGPSNPVVFRAVVGETPTVLGGVLTRTFVQNVGIILQGCQYVTFEGIHFDGNNAAQNGIAIFSIGAGEDTTNNTIRGCVFYNMVSSGLTVYAGTGGNVANARVENNLIYNCAGSQPLNTFGYIHLRRAEATVVVHNTIVNKTHNTQVIVHIQGSANQISGPISNNIFYAGAGPEAMLLAGANPTGGDNNLWFLGPNVNFSNTLSFGGWRGAGFDTNGIISDPQFHDIGNNQFQLSPGSPAIDAGGALTPAVTSDHAGVSRPKGSAPDIGAFEFDPAGPAIFAMTYRSNGVDNDDVVDVGNAGMGVGMLFTFTIRNVGGQTLNLTGNPRVAVSNLDNCIVSVSTVPAAAIASGSTTTVVFDVTGTNLGPFSFDVTIPNSDATKNPFTFTVEGDVVNPEPEISVQRPAGTELTSGGNINVGTLPVGAMFTYDFTIENIGSATLNLTGTPAVAVTVNSGNPTVNVDPQPAGAVALQQTTDFSVEVTPTQTGAFSLTLTIVSDAANTPNFTVTIQGTGADMPYIDVDDTLDFGTLVAGQTVNKDLVINNIGSQDLSVTNISLLHPAFGIVTAVNLPLTIPANSSSTVTFRFQPSEAGTFNATLVITSNSGGVAGTSTIVAFTGTATTGSGTLKKKKGCGITPDAQGLPIGLLVFVLMIALGVIRRRVH